MTTFTDVFERKEIKYRLNAQQHAAMREALDGRMAPDAFGRTRISSLYLDTPERLLIERSLDKPLYKEKLRLRSYGAPQDSDRVFVEIKKKYKGIVYKRRVGCSLAAARAYLGGVPYRQACARFPLADSEMADESLAPRSLQIAREIDSMIERYETLRPSMTIACERVAYAPAIGRGGLADAAASAGFAIPDAFDDVPDDLRITFDERISYQDMLATRDGVARALLPEGDVVMEVKAAGPFPLWLVHALDACEARPSSFSKYGAAYRACSSGAASVAAPARQPARPAHARAEAKADRLAAALRDGRPRHFRAPAARRTATAEPRHAATRG